MSLLDRIQKYKNVEKGPLRTFKKTEINNRILYSCPNGICVFKTEKTFPLDTKDCTVVEIGEDYTIIQLKNFEK